MPRIVAVLALSLILFACGGGSKKVPDVVGMDFANAEKALKAAGLSARVDGSQEGTVQSQSPAAGEAPLEDGVIALVFEAEGTPDTGVPVPDLTGKTVAEAETLLEGAGFHMGAVTFRIVDQPANVIVDQSPKPNNPIAPGQPVAVTAADENLFLMPVVVGKTEDQAKEALAGLMDIEKVERSCRPGAEPVNSVYESIPRSGDSSARTSKAILRIKDDCVPVPDVREKDRGVAFAALNRVGLLGNPTGSRFDPPKKDKVAGQIPASGTLLAKGEQVNLIFYSDVKFHIPGRFKVEIQNQGKVPKQQGKVGVGKAK